MEDGSVRSWQEGRGSFRRGNGGIKGLLTKMEAGVREINKAGQSIREVTVENHDHSLVLRRQGKRQSLGTLLIRGLAVGKGHLAGAVAFGGGLQSKLLGSTGVSEMKTPAFFSFLPSVSSIPLDDPNEPQRAGSPGVLSEEGSLLGHRAG